MIRTVSSWSPLGLFAKMKADPQAFYADLRAEHGDWVRFRLGPLSIVLVSDPEAVQALLRADGDGIEKGDSNDALRPMLEHSVFLADGEPWAIQRRAATPHFALKKLPDLCGATIRETEAELCVEGELALAPAVRTLVMRVASEVFLGTDLLNDPETRARLNELWLLNDALQDPATLFQIGRRKRRRALAQEFRDALREGLPGASPALLTALASAVDPKTGRELTEEQLVDEGMTLILTAQECSAIATCWTLLLLGAHPDEQAKVRASLEGVPIEASALWKVGALRRAIDEALRLYPPAWLLARRTTRPVVVEGVELGAGQLVFVAPWVVHRDPTRWAEPERYDPDRWVDLDRDTRRGFVPFGVGPRTCLGMRLALSLTQTVVARLLRTHRIETLGELVLDAGLTLRPDDGNRVRVDRSTRAGP